MGHANTIHSAQHMEVLSLIYTIDFRGEEIKKYVSFKIKKNDDLYMSLCMLCVSVY